MNFSCPICYELFDKDARRPLFLACGHTFCQLCLAATSAESSEVHCPYKCEQSVCKLEDLPQNAQISDGGVLCVGCRFAFSPRRAPLAAVRCGHSLCEICVEARSEAGGCQRCAGATPRAPNRALIEDAPTKCCAGNGEPTALNLATFSLCCKECVAENARGAVVTSLESLSDYRERFLADKARYIALLESARNFALDERLLRARDALEALRAQANDCAEALLDAFQRLHGDTRALEMSVGRALNELRPKSLSAAIAAALEIAGEAPIGSVGERLASDCAINQRLNAAKRRVEERIAASLAKLSKNRFEAPKVNFIAKFANLSKILKSFTRKTRKIEKIKAFETIKIANLLKRFREFKTSFDYQKNQFHIEDADFQNGVQSVERITE